MPVRSNMFPGSAAEEVLDRGLTDPQFKGQLLPLYLFVGIALAAFAYLGFCEFGARVVFPSTEQFRMQSGSVEVSCGGSPFGGHVSHVVRLASKKKMIRINTSPVVTFMTDKHTCWDRSVVQFPRYAVGEELPAFPARTPTESSISPCSAGSFPLPAVISLLNFSPEQFGDSFTGPSAGPTTKLTLTCPDFERPGQELFSTLFANPFDVSMFSFHGWHRTRQEIICQR